MPAYLLCDIPLYTYILARVSRVEEQWDFVVARARMYGG